MTPPQPVITLLAIWQEPAQALRLSDMDWDGVVRVARSAKLLASLADKFETAGVKRKLPQAVQDALTAQQRTAQYLAQMVQATLLRVERTLKPLAVEAVLLKGAAYLAQGLPAARGRLVSDVDLLIPRARLVEVEQALLLAGWASQAFEAYDDRYYREWSHELPPFRTPDQPLELDVHHQILPPTGRLHPDADALLAASTPLPDSTYSVLAPPDQVLHACAHAFQDSDCTNRLRDVADIDSLLRSFGNAPDFWNALRQRAQLHELGRPLWWGIHAAAQFFRTPIPHGFARDIDVFAPPSVPRHLMGALLAITLPPGDPDRLPGTRERASRMLMTIRYHWLRMPPRLLARHAAAKAARQVKAAWTERFASRTGIEGQA
jgi:hypothetical protein